MAHMGSMEMGGLSVVSPKGHSPLCCLWVENKGEFSAACHERLAGQASIIGHYQEELLQASSEML